MKIFEFGPVFQVEMSFKEISDLKLLQAFCLMEWNRLCNFVKGLYKKKDFCAIII